MNDNIGLPGLERKRRENARLRTQNELLHTKIDDLRQELNNAHARRLEGADEMKRLHLVEDAARRLVVAYVPVFFLGNNFIDALADLQDLLGIHPDDETEPS